MSYVGARVRRAEDPRLVQGNGQYVGDLALPGMLHVGFVRSPYAHARILSIDLAPVRAMPGVAAAYSADDLPDLGRAVPPAPFPADLRGHGFSPLAGGTARYAGEPVAVVLAEDPYLLADALEAAEVEYEELPVVSDPETATGGGSAIWEDAPDNIAATITTGFGDVDAVFAKADVIVEERFEFSRAAGAAMEPRAVAAQAGGDTGYDLTMWDSTQAPHSVRDRISQFFGLDPNRVRVIAPDVGGGFGVKGSMYPEEFVVAGLALHQGRPVRWVATRTEDLMTTGHGRGQIHHARLAARNDGTILALDDHLLQDLGAYSPSGLGVGSNTLPHLLGPYRLQAMRARLNGVYTNRVITVHLRGGGRPEGVYVMERLVDRLAERLGLDRAEIRRRNFIPPEAFPYDTGFARPRGGNVIYDSGTYPDYLQGAMDLVGYDDFPARQESARHKGRYLGLGLTAFIESTGMGSEGSRITIDEDGRVGVAVGSPSQGQGHATTFAQMVADRLGARLEDIAYISGDTEFFGWGTGTFGSRMGQFGGNAVSLAAQELRRRLLEQAAGMLEISPQDLEIVESRVEVRGVPQRGVTLAEVARAANGQGDLTVESAYQPEQGTTYAGGVSAAIVEVDPETGAVHILKYVVVHDCGTVINPTVVEGQIEGGVAHGIGNALYEAFVYSPDGQLLTSTFADYSLPGAGDIPLVDIIHHETPSPFNPEGIKGAGEGGTIAAIPTIVSAVENALAPFGVHLNDVPISRELLVNS